MMHYGHVSRLGGIFELKIHNSTQMEISKLEIRNWKIGLRKFRITIVHKDGPINK